MSKTKKTKEGSWNELTKSGARGYFNYGVVAAAFAFIAYFLLVFTGAGVVVATGIYLAIISIAFGLLFTALTETRFYRVEKRFDDLERRFDHLEGRFDHLERRLCRDD